MTCETICDGEDQRCQICGQNKSVCCCMRLLDDGTKQRQHVQAHATVLELQWRHSHWWARRERIIAAMAAGDVSWRRREAFMHCGACARTQWSATEGRRRIAASYCHDRNCEPCMRAKANKLAKNLETRLHERPAGKYRFVTLTLRHSDDPLDKSLKHLVKSFRRLRASKWWKERAHGGAVTIEVKLSETGWHPHLHIVLDSEWMNQDELSDAWNKATGGSFIVDVRALKDAHDAAFYVAKYVTKGTSPSVWADNATANEWISASKAVRMCSTFGTWRGFALTANGTDPGDWETEDTLDRLICRASEGDRVAADILLSLRPPGTADALDLR